MLEIENIIVNRLNDLKNKGVLDSNEIHEAEILNGLLTERDAWEWYNMTLDSVMDELEKIHGTIDSKNVVEIYTKFIQKGEKLV